MKESEDEPMVQAKIESNTVDNFFRSQEQELQSDFLDNNDNKSQITNNKPMILDQYSDRLSQFWI